MEVADQSADVLGGVQQTPDAGEQVRALGGVWRKPFELLEQPADFRHQAVEAGGERSTQALRLGRLAAGRPVGWWLEAISRTSRRAR